MARSLPRMMHGWLRELPDARFSSFSLDSTSLRQRNSIQRREPPYRIQPQLRVMPRRVVVEPGQARGRTRSKLRVARHLFFKLGLQRWILCDHLPRQFFFDIALAIFLLLENRIPE